MQVRSRPHPPDVTTTLCMDTHTESMNSLAQSIPPPPLNPVTGNRFNLQLTIHTASDQPSPAQLSSAQLGPSSSCTPPHARTHWATCPSCTPTNHRRPSEQQEQHTQSLSNTLAPADGHTYALAPVHAAGEIPGAYTVTPEKRSPALRRLGAAATGSEATRGVG